MDKIKLDGSVFVKLSCLKSKIVYHNTSNLAFKTPSYKEATVKANPKLLRQVSSHIDWAQGIGRWGDLQKYMRARTRQEILDMFRDADDVLPLVQQLSQAIGYIQANENIPFAYGFTDPPDVCGRQIERKAGAI